MGGPSRFDECGKTSVLSVSSLYGLDDNVCFMRVIHTEHPLQDISDILKARKLPRWREKCLDLLGDWTFFPSNVNSYESRNCLIERAERGFILN